MGKAKLKNHKHEEHHLGTIREQKKEIKKLNQRIKHLEHELGYRQNKSEEIKEIEELPDCPSCKEGFLKELVILNRRIKSCRVCDYRTKAIKI